MPVPSLIELAESGAHFGHNRSFTYPRAKQFVFAVRNNVSLINLEKTQAAIEEAQKIIAAAKDEGKTILLVGTKNSVRQIVARLAVENGLPFITERWYGGTLTNFNTILSTIKKMNELEKFLASEKISGLSKIERLRKTDLLARYHRFLGGLTNLTKLPDLIIVAAASSDKIALQEARQVGIKTIAITDTDIDPDIATLPIPANDDAPKAIELILTAILSKPSAKTIEPKNPVAVEDKQEEKPAKTKKEKTIKKTVATKPAAKKTAVKTTDKKTAEKSSAKKTSPKTTKKATKWQTSTS